MGCFSEKCSAYPQYPWFNFFLDGTLFDMCQTQCAFELILITHWTNIRYHLPPTDNTKFSTTSIKFSLTKINDTSIIIPLRTTYYYVYYFKRPTFPLRTFQHPDPSSKRSCIIYQTVDKTKMWAYFLAPQIRLLFR